MHAQVTAVPVSRQGSGVSVHELRLPSNNSAAACRVDGRCAPPSRTIAWGLGSDVLPMLACCLKTHHHTPETTMACVPDCFARGCMACWDGMLHSIHSTQSRDTVVRHCAHIPSSHLYCMRTSIESSLALHPDMLRQWSEQMRMRRRTSEGSPARRPQGERGPHQQAALSRAAAREHGSVPQPAAVIPCHAGHPCSLLPVYSLPLAHDI